MLFLIWAQFSEGNILLEVAMLRKQVEEMGQLNQALDLRPVSAADTDEACPVAIGHGGRAQQDVLKVAPSGILGVCLC